MTWLFSLRGRLLQLPYLMAFAAVFLSQHLVVAAAYLAAGEKLRADFDFWAAPMVRIAALEDASVVAMLLAMVWLGACAWALVCLSFRRAFDARVAPWIAALAMAPLVQHVLLLILVALPTSRPLPEEVATEHSPRPSSGAWAVAAGVAVSVVAVALSALGFGQYGLGIFLFSPFLAGALTAYLANRGADRGKFATTGLVVIAAVMGGIALILCALEGVACLIIASPLALYFAFLGGVFGRHLALQVRLQRRHTLSSIGLLPIVLAAESALPASLHFDTVQAIEIAAPADRVWQAVIAMEPIAAEPGLPFQLGVAYPVSAEILGEGVGAVRHGVFSTGTAIERVTEWIPGRKLAFIVLDDVPGIIELSPWTHVHAPHVEGYFVTKRSAFALTSLPDGGTRLTLETQHELELDPAPYWLPLARWIVAENNARVLAHLRGQAERAAP